MSSARNYRLSKYVKPERYEIMLRLDLEYFTFDGKETIYLSLEHATKKIVLHAAELVISDVAIFDGKDSENTFGKVLYNEKVETVTLTFPKIVRSGKKELHLKFTGILNDKMRGFYRSHYEVHNTSKYMAVTQFESTDARRAFPCIDEPGAKAIFDVTLEIPSNTTAISNTIEDMVKEHEPGYKVVHFVPTPKMSTYLLAFIVGQFEFIEKKTKTGTLVRVFTTPGKKHQAELALDTGVKLLEFYNEYFDVAYPLPVLDLIAIPDFAAGAMENWGAVTFRESALLFDAQNSSLANKERVVLVIAHELAHMWFGDLVTMEWWTHLWLNEGFATFMEYVAINTLFPQWHLWDQFIAIEHNSALSLDGLKNSHPIEVTVHHPSEIGAIFDEVSYAKGASVLYMLWNYLGDENFRKGLSYYLKKFSYKNASTEDLWDAFEKICKKPIAKIMRNWTQKPGYPVLKIIKTKSSLTISQRRFFASSAVSKTAKDKTLWQVPLKLMFANSQEQTILISKKETRLPVGNKSDWIKINSGETSFARVAYESLLLTNLQDAIIIHSLPTADRLGLIRDVFDLAQAGLTKTSDALEFVSVYKNEEEYVVWLEIAGKIRKVENLLSEDELLLKKYHTFARGMFATIAKKAGWDKRLHENHTDTLLRSLVLASSGKYGDEETMKTARVLFDKFIKQKKAIDPDIRGVVYSLVARNADKKTVDILFNLYKKETLSQEKERIAGALSMVQNEAFIKEVLDWSISKDVRSQDTPRIIFSLFLNAKSCDLTWKFIKKNWQKLSKQYAGSHGFSRLLDAAGEFVDTKYSRDIKSFFKKNPTPELDRAIRQVVEQIETNSDWLKRDRKEIAEFFGNFEKLLK